MDSPYMHFGDTANSPKNKPDRTPMRTGYRKNDDFTTVKERVLSLAKLKPRAVLLIPYSFGTVPGGLDRFEITGSVTVGRKHPSGLVVEDGWLSGVHFALSFSDGEAFIQDLGSTNGTYVNGVPVVGQQRLPGSAVIRAGRTLFVFHLDGAAFLEPTADHTFGMAGPFHVTPLIRELQRLALSSRHVLLTGPSGAGKELAAHALASASHEPSPDTATARMTRSSIR